MQSGSAKNALKLNQDFVPFSFSASGAVNAPLVFAGYGISAGEFGYDDYAGADVKDKIVVMFEEELKNRYDMPPKVTRMEKELFQILDKIFIINAKDSIAANIEKVLSWYFRRSQ